MAKKTSRRYVVVLVLCGILLVGLGAVGLIDMRPAAHEVSLPISVGSLSE